MVFEAFRSFFPHKFPCDIEERAAYIALSNLRSCELIVGFYLLLPMSCPGEPIVKVWYKLWCLNEIFP